MKKLGIFLLIISFSFILGLHKSEARYHDYYRTYEVIKINENGLTLRDNDGNVIEVQKDPTDYKVGYKVRYDKIRNRLHPDRWQDYRVIAVSDSTITLQHKTGDQITIKGNYLGTFKVGDQVRYDSIANKLRENPPK